MPSENKPAIAQGQKSKPEPAIVVSHVSMLFKRAKDEATSVKELLVRAVRGQNHYEMFKALDNINLTIQKGEVVGIIGTNGSGKSTLLKIISGALIPTRGKVLVDRKSVQLLTLGTGFDPELTGRENVYLNGAIIGYPKSTSIKNTARLSNLRSWKVSWRKRYATIPPAWSRVLALPLRPSGIPRKFSFWMKF